MSRYPLIHRFLLFLLLAAGAFAQASFVMGPNCSGVHCTAHEDDNAGLLPPIKNFGQIFVDLTTSGSGVGVGCSSNGTYIGCYTSTGLPHIHVYDAFGHFIYGSGATFASAVGGGSVPTMGADGGMVACDELSLYRWGPTGTLLYSTPLPWAGVASVGNGSGAYPCGSVKVAANGQFVVLTVGGPQATFVSATGALIGPNGCSGATCALWAGQTPGTFSSTANYYTAQKEGACIDGNRVYRAMASTADGVSSYLFAMDSSSTGMVVGAQSLSFTGPSLASPMCAKVSGKVNIYADYGSVSPGTSAGFLGWTDNGSSLSIVSGFPVSASTVTGGHPNIIRSNFALDAGQGCFWTYVKSGNALYCIDLATAAVDHTINTGSGFIPNAAALTWVSDRTCATNPANSHLVCVMGGNTGSTSPSYVVAIDMVSQTLLWYYMVNANSNTDSANGQFPTMLSSRGLPVVGFTSNTTGLRLLGGGGLTLQ